MTTTEILPIIHEILTHPNDLRGVITYHGEQEGQIMLVDFSNSGKPFTDNKVCFWSKQRDVIDDAGHYRGTDELEYGSFKTIANAVAHILIEVDNTDDFHAETF